MQSDTPDSAAARLFAAVDHQLIREGQTFDLKGGLQLAHLPVPDTALAACLVVLGIPFREPGPYTDHVDLDAHGNEVSRRKCWWLGNVSPGEASTAHRTEELLAAWNLRARFEADPKFQGHPLSLMRQAIDARDYWLDVMHGRQPLPCEVRGRVLTFATTSLREACVLKAGGFTPLAFAAQHFIFSPTRADLTGAATVLGRSLSLEMTLPEQWHRRVLHVVNEMLKVAKGQSVIILERFDDQTLLLSADATPQTRARFHGMI